MVHWFSYLTLFSFQYIVTNAIWNNESYTRLFTDSSKLSSASIESEDYTVGDTYDGDLLHHIHNKAIQRLLNRKGIMKKFPTPTLEEIQKNKESQKHSSFRKQVSYKATGYLDNQIFTTKSCSGFVESSIIFGVGFCVPTSGGGYLLDATKSFKKITIIINEYIDQKCQYLSQQFLTTQSSYCQVINNAFETFTYYATSSVPLQPVDGPEFNIYLDNKCTSLLQSTAYNKHYCFNAENGLSYHATCDGLVYFIGSTCSTPYQPKIPTMAPTPVSQKVAAQSCIEGYFVTPWSYNYTIGYLGISCAIVPDISAYSCFSAYEMLQLESGESKFMKDIKIGDSILVAMSDNNRKLSSLSKEIIQNDNRYTNTISYQNDIISTTTNHDHYHHHHRRRFAYSPVVAIPHSINNKIKSKFLLVTLSSGISIQITPNHLLLTRNCNNKNNDNNHNILSLHPASSLIADLSCVETTNGIEMVIEVTTVYLEGVYTVVTLDGEYIVVNGIIVSPFANSHYLGHKFYEIYRFVYKYFPSWLLVSKLFVNTIDEVVDILSSIMS